MNNILRSGWFPVVFLVMFVCLPVWGKLIIEKPIGAIEPVTTEQDKVLATLQSILHSMEALQQQVREEERLLRSAGTDQEKTRMNEDLNALMLRLNTLEQDFEGIATGIDLTSFATQPHSSFDWKQEMQEVLGPIIEEVKRATARPRELERLRSDVIQYERRLVQIRQAIQNVKILSVAQTSAQVKKRLGAVEKKWSELEQETTNQLVIAQYLLEEKLYEKKPIVESVQDVVRTFFKSRGKNLLLALLAFFNVLLLFRLCYWLIRKFLLTRLARKPTFYSRLAEVSYHTLTFIGATTALLIVLYISGDWVLLGIAMIFLFGIAWTAKQGLPMFWEQVKLLLNLSTVRENERVIYNGLPWKVASLNLYSKLHNPALKGGMIRLPLRELLGLQSRPFNKEEPWFPCHENDWVLLNDGTFGKVWMQTPEMVQLILIGGSRKTYPTLDFLHCAPNNLSTNFRIALTFGIDYRHQAASTQDIPQRLQTLLFEELVNRGYKEHLLHIGVEFKSAGTSSLDLAILADFTGGAAQDYEILSRLLQRIAVEACNRQGWVIPFPQITVHAAESALPPTQKEIT